MSRIEAAITRLVQEAPARDAALVDELLAALAAITEPPAAAALARSIAAIVPLVGAGVDPGIALPALAMACATLEARGTLTARELDASRYEIDTLTPMPAGPPPPVAPDVPADALTRGPRRRP